MNNFLLFHIIFKVFFSKLFFLSVVNGKQFQVASDEKYISFSKKSYGSHTFDTIVHSYTFSI